MKKFLLLFVFLFLGVAVWIYWPEPPAPPAPPAPVQLTPEEQLRVLLKGDSVSAVKLATLCQSYPKQAKAILAKQQLKVRGKIKDFRIRGISSEDVDVILEGVPRFNVVMATAFNRRSSLQFGKEQAPHKFERQDRALWILQGRTSKTEIGAEGMDVEIAGQFDTIGPSGARLLVNNYNAFISVQD